MMFGEALECRTLLSGNVAAVLEGGDLSLVGDRFDNSIAVIIEGDDLVVRGLDGTTINDSTDDFVIASGATTFAGDIQIALGRGMDTVRISGMLTITGDVQLVDIQGASEFAITEATIDGDLRLFSNDSADTVSLVDARIDGAFWLELSQGRNFVSLLDSTVEGRMLVNSGHSSDVILLDGSLVGALTLSTDGGRDDVILRNTTIDGDWWSWTGEGNDFVMIDDLDVTGDTYLWLGWDSDLIVTQGVVNFAGDFVAGGLFGRRDTIELSDETTIGGEKHILWFENRSLNDLSGVNRRIDRRLDEAFDFQVLLNGVDLGELTLTVDTSANTDLVESNNTLVTTAQTLTIEGVTLPRATVSVTAGAGGTIELGDVTADSNGNYAITVDLLAGPTTIFVTAIDILERTVTEEFDLHVAVGTVVRFDSSLGSFDVELYDEDAPITVANFLGYAARYVDSIVHRQATDATAGVDVIQGGGFSLDGNDALRRITTDPAIVGEPNSANSNVRGTLAMALVGSPPNINSATSQWYINVNDNTNLDPLQFTVFGEVIGDGMDIVDAIFALDPIDINNVVPIGSGALGSVPLQNFTLQQVQLTGTVSIASGSIELVGTGTSFTTELAPTDIIEIEGQSFRVVQINSDTSLFVDASPALSITNAVFLTEPIATTIPTRDQYVVFDSIGVLLT